MQKLQVLDLENIYQLMINTNPQFKEFVNNNADKTTKDIAQEYGIDFKRLKECISI